MVDTTQILQLPLWPEGIRGLPVAIARSALFTANSKVTRVNLKNQVIASTENIHIEYTGEELRQDDEDILMQLLHLARLQPLGLPIKCSSHALIKSVGWTMNKDSYMRLREVIVRMKATDINMAFRLGGHWKEYHDSLILRAIHGGRDGADVADSLWRFAFSPEMMVLFEAYTEIDIKTRLHFSPLAKKLHSFYNSFEEPEGMPVAELYKITGSRLAHMKHFRSKLREACAELERANFLTRYSIDSATDLVRVQKAKKPSIYLP